MRLRVGELLALIGAAGVIVALFLRNYENSSGALTGWDTFGPASALMLLAAVSALVLVVATVGERSSALPIAAAIWTSVFGLAGVIAAIVRALERPQHATDVCYGSWLALGSAVAILAGAWLSMHDERTSRYGPASPETRPLPPA